MYSFDLQISEVDEWNLMVCTSLDADDIWPCLCKKFDYTITIAIDAALCFVLFFIGGQIPKCNARGSPALQRAGAHWSGLLISFDLCTYTKHGKPSFSTCFLVQLNAKLFVVNKKWLFLMDNQCICIHHCDTQLSEEQKLYRNKLQIWNSIAFYLPVN